MLHTQLPDTIHPDKVFSARPLAGSSSVSSVVEADLSLLDSCNRFTITSSSLGDLRFQDSDFTSYSLSNQQFSVTAVTISPGWGSSVLERFAHIAYGQPTFLDASGTPLTTQTSTLNARYLYTGRKWDAAPGLYHFRAPWMSGVAGRFLARYPMGYIDGMHLQVNRFIFTGDDPHGLSSSCPKTSFDTAKRDCQRFSLDLTSTLDHAFKPFELSRLKGMTLGLLTVRGAFELYGSDLVHMKLAILVAVTTQPRNYSLLYLMEGDGESSLQPKVLMLTKVTLETDSELGVGSAATRKLVLTLIGKAELFIAQVKHRHACAEELFAIRRSDAVWIPK